jgi:hypothetical protein
MELKYGVRTSIPAVVGMMSQVGIGSKEYPLSFGNYFDFANDDRKSMFYTSIRCLNFWAENMTEARRRFLPDGNVDVLLYAGPEHEGRFEDKDGHNVIKYNPKWAIVDDKRIPADWYHNKLCFTGCRRPPMKFAKEIYEYLGDPNNEFEQYTDPKTYYDKRGWVYHDNGVVSSKPGKFGTQPA